MKIKTREAIVQIICCSILYPVVHRSPVGSMDPADHVEGSPTLAEGDRVCSALDAFKARLEKPFPPLVY